MIKNINDIKKISEASLIVAKVHKSLKEAINENVSLKTLDELAYKIIIENKAIPAFKGYDGFPSSICTSLNETIVHGIPNDYKLKNGDVISVDVGVEKDGFFADAAFTTYVGNIKPRTKLLIETTKKALMETIKFAKPGISLGELGAFIGEFAKKQKFAIVKEYGGHGIGKELHEEPFIFNYKNNSKILLEENMVICIEPMFVDGDSKLFVDPIDYWSVKTVNGSISAHEEHTILITKSGGKILTKEG